MPKDKEVAAQAASPPTAAPGEYDETLEWLNSLANISRLCGNLSSEKGYIEAAAAIRKLEMHRSALTAALDDALKRTPPTRHVSSKAPPIVIEGEDYDTPTAGLGEKRALTVDEQRALSKALRDGTELLYTFPAGPTAAPGEEAIEAAAIAIWTRFAPGHREEWADEQHKREYRDAALAVLEAAKAATKPEPFYHEERPWHD